MFVLNIVRSLSKNTCLFYMFVFSFPVPVFGNYDGLVDLERSMRPSIIISDNPMSPLGTEVEIFSAKSLIEKAPAGLYLSVGGERSFRGASMSNATGLVIMDYSRPVLQFARINRELLKADDLQQYLHLRFDATYKEWKKFQKNSKKQTSLTQQDYDAWKKFHKSTVGFNLITKLKKGKNVRYEDKEYLVSDLDFTTGNYLFDSDLFLRLHHLAVEEKVHLLWINLTEEKNVNRLIATLKDSEEKIGVLDLNNLNIDFYMGFASYMKLVRRFLLHGFLDSELLIMAIDPDSIINNHDDPLVQHKHFYYAKSFSYLEQTETSTFQISLSRIYWTDSCRSPSNQLLKSYCERRHAEGLDNILYGQDFGLHQLKEWHWWSSPTVLFTSTVIGMLTWKFLRSRTHS